MNKYYYEGNSLTKMEGKVMLIGICGKSGSGKTTLSKKLEQLSNNIIYLDIDKIGHNVLLYQNVKNELIDTFGLSIIKENEINRKVLSKLVFNSKEMMDKLTYITWKYMEMEIDNFIKKNENKIIILDWQLLPKTKYFNMCKIKILLDISYQTRKERAIKRDNITMEEFDLREKASINYNVDDFDIVINEKQKLNILN